jgi:hypothetical protein
MPTSSARARVDFTDVSCTTACFESFSSLLYSPCDPLQVLGNTRRTAQSTGLGHSRVFAPHLLFVERARYPQAHYYCALTAVPYDFTKSHDVTNLLYNPAPPTISSLDAATRVTVTLRHHARGTSVELA